MFRKRAAKGRRGPEKDPPRRRGARPSARILSRDAPLLMTKGAESLSLHDVAREAG